MQAMLLAAGYGTRLRPYSQIRPKPLFPVLNRPLLFHLLDQLRDYAPLVVNCHHLSGQIQTALAQRPELRIQYEPEILGTGGSLRQACDHLQDAPLLVMNGDIFHDIDLAAIWAAHQRSGLGVTLALHDYPRFNKVGVTQDGQVRGFHAAEGEQLAFTGIHILTPEVIRMIPVGRFYHIIDLYETLAQQGQVGYCRTDGCFWRDMGTPADYLALHGELLGSSGKWLIAPSAHIGRNVFLEDWGCIGAHARIGDGARLSRCVVWDHATVLAGDIHQDAIIP